MEAIPKTIEYYKTAKGEKPFLEWFEAQEKYTQARILVRFKQVEQGNLGDHHSDGEGVWSLRFDFGPGFRVYYGLTDRQKLVLLLTGGTKKRQNKDIVQAIEYWRDYKANDKPKENKK